MFTYQLVETYPRDVLKPSGVKAWTVVFIAVKI